jgi:hypothetical protein
MVHRLSGPVQHRLYMYAKYEHAFVNPLLYEHGDVISGRWCQSYGYGTAQNMTASRHLIKFISI